MNQITFVSESKSLR